MRHHWIRGFGVATGVTAALTLAAAFSWALESRSYNLWGSMLVVPIVVAANALILARVLAREEDAWIVRVIWLGFVAKLVGIAGRYVMAYGIYGGASDAERYNRYAAWEYLRWRDGNFTLSTAPGLGTRWLENVTTAVYTVVGPAPITGFVVFGMAAFWGVYLFYRAFRIGVPTADSRRYALLAFLLPSLVFWPSSIGKEAWLLLFVGLTAYGGARFFAGERLGLAVAAAGAAGTAVVRPHIAVLTMGALLAAQLLRAPARNPTGVLTKLLGVATIAIGVLILAQQSAAFLELDEVSWEALDSEIQRRSDLATQGGSEFESVPLRSLTDLPVGVFTVLFRPMPWEALNAQMLVQSLEGVLLIALVVTSVRRWRVVARVARQYPYVAYSVFHVLGFVWAFSGVGNFGILARQRILMLPALLVLLAVASRRSQAVSLRAADDGGSNPAPLPALLS